jgi:predicted methyltransferase MtxX (methanogen marker protein 4)
MAGNLIYRTLTRLGSGGSLGALYFPLLLRLADTSRSGSIEEYLGAVALANIGAQMADADGVNP